MFEGYARAAAEYEVKMSDPFRGEDEEKDYDYERCTDPYEEMLIERMYENETENRLWYS